jgi:hypothetical protein
MKASELRKLIREEVRWGLATKDKRLIKKLIDDSNQTRSGGIARAAERELIRHGIYNSDGEVAADAPDWVLTYYEENWT